MIRMHSHPAVVVTLNNSLTASLTTQLHHLSLLTLSKFFFLKKIQLLNHIRQLINNSVSSSLLTSRVSWVRISSISIDELFLSWNINMLKIYLYSYIHYHQQLTLINLDCLSRMIYILIMILYTPSFSNLIFINFSISILCLVSFPYSHYSKSITTGLYYESAHFLSLHLSIEYLLSDPLNLFLPVSSQGSSTIIESSPPSSISFPLLLSPWSICSTVNLLFCHKQVLFKALSLWIPLIVLHPSFYKWIKSDQ